MPACKAVPLVSFRSGGEACVPGAIGGMPEQGEARHRTDAKTICFKLQQNYN
jgi:hypothetical protein